MTYEEARKFIDQSNRYGIKPGLETITQLLDRLGNPQEQLKIIHVAGTNGKGSTSAFITSILSEAGYRVGRYLSPAVFSYRERIQISDYLTESHDGSDNPTAAKEIRGVDGIPKTDDSIRIEYITEEGVIAAVERIKPVCESMLREGLSHPTSFEIETAMAFLYLLWEKVDFAVIEVGMGGLLDATNVIKHPVCSVITSISMDHMQYLGDTLEKIAAQKSGIIKAGSPVVTCRQEPQVIKVLEDTCLEIGTKLTLSDFDKIIRVSYNAGEPYNGRIGSERPKENKDSKRAEPPGGIRISAEEPKENRDSKRTLASYKDSSGNIIQAGVEAGELICSSSINTNSNGNVIQAEAEVEELIRSSSINTNINKNIIQTEAEPEETSFTIKKEDKEQEYKIRLLGEYQVENAVLALKAIDLIRLQGYPISENAVRAGLYKTKWSGRFEIIARKPYLVIDGAHNEDAALVLRRSVQLYFTNRRIVYMIGVLADKDYKSILRIMAPLAGTIITLTPDNSRALASGELAKEASKYCGRVLDAGNVNEAVRLAYQEAGSEDVIIAFGSLSFLGDLVRRITHN